MKPHPSSVQIKMLDSATTRSQLKIKEALHIHLEIPSLNKQIFHVNLQFTGYLIFAFM